MVSKAQVLDHWHTEWFGNVDQYSVLKSGMGTWRGFTSNTGELADVEILK